MFERQPLRPGNCHRIRRAAAALCAAGALCTTAATAQQQTDELLGLINDRRASAQQCAGKPVAMAGALSVDDALANAPPVAGRELRQALRSAGYSASRSLTITLTGPRDAASAMRVLAKNYCRQLSSSRYSDIGISRDGRHWRILLAQPVLSSDLGPWRAAGMQVLELVNAARAEPRRCGKQDFDAAPPVAWNAKLAATALAHSSDMARRDYFAHEGPRGSRVDTRASRHDYDWRTIGENIAAGQGSARKVMAGWLSSPGHCANIMRGDFSEMGAAYAVERDSSSTIYWTQVFGRPPTAAGGR